MDKGGNDDGHFLTRLHDWGATPAGALVRPKDPLEYERKLAVHREGLPGFGAWS